MSIVSHNQVGYLWHVPDFTGVCQTEVKLAQVTGCVLFRLPVRLFGFLTKPAFVAVFDFGDKSVVCLLRFETASEVHRDDLFWCKHARQFFLAHSVLEYCKEPVGCIVTSPTFFANFVIKLGWVGLKSNRGLLAGSIIAAAFIEFTMGSRSGFGCRARRTDTTVRNWRYSGVSTRG